MLFSFLSFHAFNLLSQSFSLSSSRVPSLLMRVRERERERERVVNEWMRERVRLQLKDIHLLLC